MRPLYERQPPLNIALQHEWGPLQHRVRHALRVPPTSQQCDQQRARVVANRADFGRDDIAGQDITVSGTGHGDGPDRRPASDTRRCNFTIQFASRSKFEAEFASRSKFKGWVERDTRDLALARKLNENRF